MAPSTETIPCDQRHSGVASGPAGTAKRLGAPNPDGRLALLDSAPQVSAESEVKVAPRAPRRRPGFPSFASAACERRGCACRLRPAELSAIMELRIWILDAPDATNRMLLQRLRFRKNLRRASAAYEAESRHHTQPVLERENKMRPRGIRAGGSRNTQATSETQTPIVLRWLALQHLDVFAARKVLPKKRFCRTRHPRIHAGAGSRWPKQHAAAEGPCGDPGL